MAKDLAEIKNLLRSIRTYQCRIDADMEHLRRLRAMAESVRGLDYSKDTVRGGAKHSALEESVAALVDYEAKINADVAEWTRRLREARHIIDQLADGRYHELLTLRYCDFWGWERIAAKMAYSWRQVHRLHAQALRAAKKIYDVEKDGTQWHTHL